MVKYLREGYLFRSIEIGRPHSDISPTYSERPRWSSRSCYSARRAVPHQQRAQGHRRQREAATGTTPTNSGHEGTAANGRRPPGLPPPTAGTRAPPSAEGGRRGLNGHQRLCGVLCPRPRRRAPQPPRTRGGGPGRKASATRSPAKHPSPCGERGTPGKGGHLHFCRLGGIQSIATACICGIMPVAYRL